MCKITVDSWFETSYCKFVMYILLFRDILKIYTTGTIDVRHGPICTLDEYGARIIECH